MRRCGWWALGAAAIGFAAACGGDDSADSSAKGCVPGQQITCGCGDGKSGIQICRDDGKAYAACQCNTADAGLDQGPDAIDDGTTNDVSGDAAADAPGDQTSEPGGECVHPTDNLTDPKLPTPTPGSCSSNAALTCDPISHQMVADLCDAAEECIAYSVEEHPEDSPSSGRTYTWAACIPKAATSCSFVWTPSTGGWPPGEWLSSFTPKCDGNDVEYCELPPIPDDAFYAAFWAGTTTGYVHVQSCGSGQVCADNPTYPGSPDCYASPLTPCATADSHCEGGVLFDCYGYPYLKKVDCGAKGELCREDCDVGLPYKTAACRPPLAPGAPACDPSSFVKTCQSSSTLTACGECFQENGQCKCYAASYDCNQLGCGFSTSCQCADVKTSTGSAAECIDSALVLCDPASTPDSCANNSAQTCIGYLLSIDCTKYGEVCDLGSGKSGCVASPPTTCDASLVPSCSGNAITGCCPATGQFVTNTYSLSCVPGKLVKFDCSALYAPMKCFATPTGALCMM